MNKPTPSDLSEVLFAAAVAQMRADVLRLSAKKMAKEVCKCDAYAFPHRQDSGKCCDETRNPEPQDGDDLKEHDRIANILLDAQEAMAINAGRY